jgi:hypothetical protein
MSETDNPSTLNCIANLALTYKYHGNWNAVEKLKAEVMDIHKGNLAMDPPGVCINHGQSVDDV